MEVPQAVELVVDTYRPAKPFCPGGGRSLARGCTAVFANHFANAFANTGHDPISW